MEISDYIAIIAILVSIATAIKQWHHDIHMNRMNLEADYFKELYSEHLLHELPKVRKYLYFRDGKLSDVDPLVNELNRIRQDSLYFYYMDNAFYLKLKKSLSDLEDYLCTCSEQEIDNYTNQTVVMDEIQNKLTKSYRRNIMVSKYVGDGPGCLFSFTQKRND